MAEIRLRDYEGADAENLNRIAVSAFAKAYDAPPIFGVAYAVYTKAL